MGAGETAGWSWTLPPYQSAFDVRATEELTTVELPGPELRVLSQADPALGYQVLLRVVAMLAERLRNTRFQVLDLY